MSQHRKIVILITMIATMVAVTYLGGVLDDFVGGLAGSLTILVGRDLILMEDDDDEI